MNDMNKKFADILRNRLCKIPYENYKSTVGNLCLHLNITDDVLYNYRYGRTFINLSMRKKINKFFLEDVFNIYE